MFFGDLVFTFKKISSGFGQIEPPTMELAALAPRKI